jgi:hypothetical protein
MKRDSKQQSNFQKSTYTENCGCGCGCGGRKKIDSLMAAGIM